MAREKLIVWTLLLGSVCSVCTGLPLGRIYPSFGRDLTKIKRCPEELCKGLQCDERGAMLASGTNMWCLCTHCKNSVSDKMINHQPQSLSLEITPTSYTHINTKSLSKTGPHPHPKTATSTPQKDNQIGKTKGRREKRSVANPTPSPGHWPVFPPEVGVVDRPVNIEVPVPEYSVQRVVVDPVPDQANREFFIIDPVPIPPVF